MTNIYHEEYVSFEKVWNWNKNKVDFFFLLISTKNKDMFERNCMAGKHIEEKRILTRFGIGIRIKLIFFYLLISTKKKNSFERSCISSIWKKRENNVAYINFFLKLN